MAPHPDHEFLGPDHDTWAEEAWTDYALAETLARFEDLSRPDQARAIRDMLKSCGEPLHEILSPADLRALRPDPDPED